MPTELVGDFLQPRARRAGIERLVAVRPEHRGKMRRVDPAEEQVAVGDGQRAAVAVAGRSRVRARALRPDAEAHAVEPADRPAAGRDGVDLHHRRADAHPGDDAFVGKLELAGIVRHVGRRTAHVEADQPIAAVRRARRDHADDAAGGAGQDRVLAAKCGRFGEAAVRLHEVEVGLVGKPAATRST